MSSKILRELRDAGRRDPQLDPARLAYSRILIPLCADKLRRIMVIVQLIPASRNTPFLSTALLNLDSPERRTKHAQLLQMVDFEKGLRW